MNIVSKTLFTLSILLFAGTSTEVFCMKQKNKESEKIRLIKQWHTTHNEFVKDGHTHTLWTREYPRIQFLWLTWTNKVERCKRIKVNGILPFDYLLPDTHEFCKKTKVLLGTIFTGSVIGIGYYFNWFRKK
jgi:hypothetical protein